MGFKTETGMTILGLITAVVMSAASCLGAVLDITDVDVDGNRLVMRAVIDGGTKNLSAGGMKVTFPADRLAFSGVTGPDGMVVNAAAAGSEVRLGYMVTSANIKRAVLEFGFRITGPEPYLFGVAPGSLDADLEGITAVRPAMWGEPSGPVMWSVPDSSANLFMYLPRLDDIREASLTINGQDVLAGVVALSQWFVDPVRNEGWLVMPGVDVPRGSYTLRLMVGYSEKTEQITTDITVR